IKLSRELSKRTRGATLYLFDEPTTGLHPQEIYKLVSIIYDLVSKGNTVIAIEHNIDFVRCADHLIDLGPGAGDEGGRLVASGSVADIASCRQSLTGRFLRYTG
ncbi:MAG: excinuclease ABC subunit UvrA, partial [Verrucomicrobia bacterium]|nr:excinuclease ABC subunit UvrA [Verrucomicrobiota bacterium]